MPISRPTDVTATLDALAASPDADLLAGGTDLVVEVNLDRRRPEHVIALRRVTELAGHDTTDGRLRLGANVTYSEVEHDLAQLVPGLAMAARTVGSPQIRNAGTLGGNLGTASPAGDTLPWLLAMDAEVELASPEGDRSVPLANFLTGPKSTARRPAELITGVGLPRVEGPQHVSKIGPRNAMVISVACFAIVLDTTNRRVRTGMGAVGPTVLRSPDAEHAVTQALDWDALTCPEDAIDAFGRACAEATAPITDHRSSAEYRRHAVGVLARRALRRCLST